MSKRIVLNSFRALSFDVLVRQALARAMPSPPPPSEPRLAPSLDGGLPVVARWLVDSAQTNRAETTGYFLHCNHPSVDGSDQAASIASTFPAR